ncbi:hypothetical protein PENSOL_c047G03164 [Penicillium solitum]|uniref:Uncharacterized protein n=1 Tax=Penicillium solitum TaxID=60172 RepID=A0A1V6QRT3_9EURO|nr:uncharacterized protein PENSOL_c047G03164 [Penicillium solitum]OQD91929.1 hypothetical protein PENSOL_c047G03164 [Penicillium solitum]
MPVDPFFIDWSGPDLEMAYASPVVVPEKGAQRNSHIRHTSKQTQPLRRLRDEYGKASSDGRNRRLLGSSDDHGGFTDDEDDHIDPVEVVGRAEKGDSQVNSQLTVLIIAVRTVVDDTWLNAARAIRASVILHKETENNASAKRLLDSLAVEFLEITDNYPMYMFPVLEQDEIYDQWPRIRTHILDIRDTDLLSIGCYRRGRSREADDNPETVLILAYPQCRIDWKPFRDDVVKLLDRARLPMVAVEISTASDWDKEERHVQVDLDSLHGLNRLYQTIAPGLTMRHGELWRVPDPEREGISRDMIKKWHIRGVDPSDEDAKRHLQTKSPCWFGMKTELAYLREMTSRMREDENYKAGEDRRKRRQSFRPMDVDEPQYAKQVEGLRELHLLTMELEQSMGAPDPGYGSVFAASGYKTRRWDFHGRPSGAKLDWALIQVLPSRLFWTMLPDGEKIREIGSLDPRLPIAGKPVWAYGCRQGLIWGLANGLQEAAFLTLKENGRKENIIIYRDLVLGLNGKPFTIPGDSGALVFTGDDILVGMLYGGRHGANSNVGYIMRTYHLLEDIKERTGAKDIRFRQ